MKKLLLIIGLLLIASVAVNIFLMTRKPQVDIKRDTTEVVRFDTITDTMPVVQTEKVTKYIILKDSVRDTITNEIVLQVVQRTYTDDSTYTAYVSGAKIDSFPRLDSISVRQKTIERTITVTITEKEKARRLRFGFYAGYGYGFKSRYFEPQVGCGITYTF